MGNQHDLIILKVNLVSSRLIRDMPSTCIYSSLPQGAIRLLRFTSAATKEKFGCELVQFQLDKTPSFNALSYCWGNPTRSVPIRCNGCEMMITPVLAEALQALLVLNRGGVEWLWIDQVCINQVDVPERGRQVDMMKDIYKRSEQTIIWLGSGIPGIEKLGTILENMTRYFKLDIDPSGARRRRRYTGDEYKALSLPPPKDPSWDVLGEILSRPWFIRSWVVQEVVFSKVSPRVLCGSHELLWEQIVSSGTWLASMCYKLTPLRFRSTTALAIRSLKLFNELEQVGLPWDLTTLLNKTIRFQTSEPRDRVYSLIGLAGEGYEGTTLPEALQANYDKPVEEVFRDVTRYIITSSGNLRILTLIRYIPDWDKYQSWVVDFAATVSWERISYFGWGHHAQAWYSVRETTNNAAGGLPAEVQNSSSENVLALKGFRIDIVGDMCAVMSSSALNSFRQDVLVAWKMACLRLGARYSTAEALARTMMVTLTADWNLTQNEQMADQPLGHFWAYLWRVYHKLHDKVPSGKYQAKVKEEYMSLLPKEAPDISDDANTYSLHLDAANHRRVFFTKNAAYVGLGSEIMQENDILCILFGAATPIVLRPDNGLFRYVGECYVYDLMHGESIIDWEQGSYTTETFHLA